MFDVGAVRADVEVSAKGHGAVIAESDLVALHERLRSSRWGEGDKSPVVAEGEEDRKNVAELLVDALDFGRVNGLASSSSTSSRRRLLCQQGCEDLLLLVEGGRSAGAGAIVGCGVRKSLTVGCCDQQPCCSNPEFRLVRNDPLVVPLIKRPE